MEILELRQNCASGLPNPARLALHLFVCGRGGLNIFAAKLLGTLQKSSELENGELSIDDSVPERFCEEFRSGVSSSCARNLNPCAAYTSPPKWGNIAEVQTGCCSQRSSGLGAMSKVDFSSLSGPGLKSFEVWLEGECQFRHR